MLSKFRYWLEKNRLQRHLNSGETLNWNLVKKVWSLSPDIDDGLIGYQVHPRIEYLAFQKALQKQILSEEELFHQLTDCHPMIVGWSLLSLLYRHSPHLLRIPESTYERKEQITWRLGYFRDRTSVGDFARKVQAQYLAELSSSPHSDNAKK
jgi:hypothetical protein